MRTLRQADFDTLVNRGRILEQDGHGIKVVRLADGTFLKTFWHRRRFSSRRLYPEWLRFVLHERALKRRGIPTVTVAETLRIPHLKRTAVRYHPLEGVTLRELAGTGRFTAELATALGRFVAGLHEAGVHFHSLHLGNILRCPKGEFGLIDISNMRVFPWPLWTRTRARNLGHVLRYPEDREALVRAGAGAFQNGYLDRTTTPRLERMLSTTLERYSETG